MPFDAMARLEDEHWWYKAKRRLVMQAMELHNQRIHLLADIGCGTGGMGRALADRGVTVIGLEYDPRALILLRQQAHDERLAAADAHHLPLANGAVDAVTCLDVLEHLDDDVAAARDLRRVLIPGGLAVVAVPAYQWLWSDHDVGLGHRRRYSARQLAGVLRTAGFHVVRTSYFHIWALPLAVVVRRTPLRRRVRGSGTEASYVGPRTNRFLDRLGRWEAGWLRHWRLTAGLSVLAVAVNPPAVGGAARQPATTELAG